MMKGIGILLSWLWGFFTTYGAFIPRGIAAMFIAFKFIFIMASEGFLPGMKYLASQTLSAEMIIHENVTLAISGSSSYTLVSFLEILVSFIVLYYLARFIANLITGSGMESRIMAWVWAFIIIAIIEFSATTFMTGSLGFIPLWDGIIYLVRNINPVLCNIHYLPSFAPFKLPPLLNASDNVTMANITGGNLSVVNETKLFMG